ncbi:MAG: hybrid sensor histidine kinase/response regulator, partial [bacterium]
YMQPEPVDLRLVVDQCLNAPNSDWKAKAEGRAVSVRLQTDVESAVVEGNADKLVVALEHLLENAVEHSPDGGQVLVMLEAQADEYRLAVVDHGPGIPKAIQGKIFYPFFSTKQRVRSSGLGLAVVHGTVVRHGGTVAIDPDWESGTRMVITFRRPLGLKEDSDITRRGQRRSGLYVLVVDDDEQIREILCDMLTIEGHNPIACADGYAALEAANSGHFDIMITDLGMPGMSGLDLAGLINESFPEIAVAMITGWGSQLDHGEVAIKGIRQVLAKPFHLRDVKDMVRKLVAV